MLKHSLCATCAFFALFITDPIKSKAQDDPQIAASVLHRDSLFWQAYNTCNVDVMRGFFTDDIEFYHDKGGVTTGLDAFMASVSHGLCGSDSLRLRREAIAGTVHVFPMRKGGVVYGAVLSGDHRFFVRQTGKAEYLDGQAKFAHLWLLRDGVWKMARVFSYDHGPARYVNLRTPIILPDSLLQRYAGSYLGSQNGSVLVTTEGTHLVVTAGGHPLRVYPETKDRFFAQERDLTFTFTRQQMVVRENGNLAEQLTRQ